MSQLQTNLTNLQAILDSVNSLPEADSSENNLSLCEVHITISHYIPGDAPSAEEIMYTTLENNVLITKTLNYTDFDNYDGASSDDFCSISAIINVVQNSFIFIYSSNGYSPFDNLDNYENLTITGYHHNEFCVIRVNNQSTASLTWIL